MKTCPRCGEDFDPEHTKHKIDHMYGEYTYEDYYRTEREEVCASCACMEISADVGEGEEIVENMGSGWDND